MADPEYKALKARVKQLPRAERRAFWWRTLKIFLRTAPKPLAKDLAHAAEHRALFSGRDLCHWCKAPIKIGASACRKCGRDQSEYVHHLQRN